MRRDIADRADLVLVISDFYARAFADGLLGHIFVEVAKMDLAAHLPIMCDFWETVLFRTGGYRRNALALHVDLHRVAPLEPEHFARWLQLWRATIDDRHEGPHAERAKIQAERIAWSMQRRLARGTGSEHVTIRQRGPAQH
ncbi:group III truncated hemoglobin [Micromonospora sp. WMMD812]|uniref:group III truncated hemoglobin n=1 Tax=Micromonospora sp. WMMD812 TaxID=3015152 RepID=UPI00248BC83C|nr:group III truncated hemoglobin [Micromonospora sp. WMMD812]WBB67694.1 group III truncated hemoglobin [Micromonospora sp. WMMD812]